MRNAWTSPKEPSTVLVAYLGYVARGAPGVLEAGDLGHVELVTLWDLGAVGGCDRDRRGRGSQLERKEL